MKFLELKRKNKKHLDNHAKFLVEKLLISIKKRIIIVLMKIII